MATKKKGKKSTKSKRAVGNEAAAKRVAKKKKTRRVSAKRTKSKSSSRKSNVAAVSAKPTRRNERRDTNAFAREAPRSRSGEQSGDLQGLRYAEGADSESVGELVEEGNAFEADVVRGVEDAEDADEREVHTHEVPEDDVPDEYLDKE